jgi:hypothetical protein
MMRQLKAIVLSAQKALQQMHGLEYPKTWLCTAMTLLVLARDA